MPSKFTDEIELHGLTFRLHRIRGYAAFEAKSDWAGVVGEEAAPMLALGHAAMTKIARDVMTPAQREAFAELGDLDSHRAFALLGIVQCMRRARMTSDDMGALVRAFILGHVDVKIGVSDEGHTQWRRIESTSDLDERLDGEHDGEVWNDLMWRQIPHCLGPTIAASAT